MKQWDTQAIFSFYDCSPAVFCFMKNASKAGLYLITAVGAPQKHFHEEEKKNIKQSQSEFGN